MTADAIYAWRSRLSKVVRGMAAEMNGEEMSEIEGKARTSSVASQSP